MDFTSLFLDALRDTPVLPHNISPSVFLGDLYSLSEETVDELLTILSGGMIETGNNIFSRFIRLTAVCCFIQERAAALYAFPRKPIVWKRELVFI